MDDVPMPIDRQFLVEHHAWVFALAQRLVGDPVEAADVAQDTLELALERPVAGERTPSRWRAWLASVARSVAHGRRRSEVRRRARQARAAREAETADPSVVAARRELAALLLDALERVPEPCRSAVRGRFVEYLTYAELARSAGVSEAAVRQRVSRGLRLLRERLDPPERRSGAWLGVLLAATASTPSAPSSSSPWLVGGMMATKQTVVAAVVVLAVGLALWQPWSAETGPPGRSVEAVTASPTPERVRARVARGAGPSSTPERVASEPAPGARDGVLRVIDDAGRAVRDARLVLPAETGDTGSSGTIVADADGLLELDHAVWRSLRSPAVVLAPGFHPEQVTAPGTVTLRAGVAVAGRVVREAGDALPTLRLEADDPDLLLAPDGTARHWMLQLGLDGHFRSPALPDAWTGRLVVGATHELVRVEGAVAERNVVPLLERREGLELVVRPRSRVRAQVLWDDGSPVADATVTVLASEVGRDRGRVLLAETDDDGWVEFALRPLERGEYRPPGLVTFTVEPREGGPSHEVSRGSRDAPLPTDVEPIVVPAGRRLDVVVRSTTGTPLVGARTGATGGRFWRSDEDGRGVLRVAADEARATFMAFGHELREVELPTASSDLEVELRPVPTLVFVPPADTELLDDLRLGLRVGPRSRLRYRAPFVGRGGVVDGRLHVELQPLGAHPAVTGFAPGESVEVRVFDLLGRESAPLVFQAPSEGTTREVEVGAGLRVFTWSGRVTTPDGRPLPGARVRLHTGLPGGGEGEAGSATARSDVAGRYRLGPLLAPVAEARLEASYPGRLPVELERLVVSADTSGPDVVLEPGRRVELEVAYGDGEPVRSRFAFAVDEGDTHLMAQRPEPGRFVFDALPDRALEARVRVDGVTQRIALPVGRSTLAVEVPRPGRILVTAERGEAEGLVQVRVRRAGEDHPLTARVTDAGPVEIAAAPGDWTVDLVRLARGADGFVPTVISESSQIVVESGEAVRVQLVEASETGR